MNSTSLLSKRIALGVALGQVTLMSLPLFVYIAFWVLVVPDKDTTELWHKPEWMFIALMLQAEAARDSIAFSNRYVTAKAHILKDANVIMHIVVIVIFALILFAALGRYEHAFKSNRALDTLQWISLGYALAFSLRCKYRAIVWEDKAKMGNPAGRVDA